MTVNAADELIPGMTEAVHQWLADYGRLFIDRAPAGLLTPEQSHARHMEETGLLGRAHTMLFVLAASMRRAETGLDAEPLPARPLPAGAYRLNPAIAGTRGPAKTEGVQS